MSKVHYLRGALAGGALAVLGGFLAPAALAAPAPGHWGALAATLSHSGTGSAAVWAGPDAVKLTVGSPTSSTYAAVSITKPPKKAPAQEPSVSTDHYAIGSPRWVISFSNGCYIFVYPTGTGQFTPASTNAQVEAGTGHCSTTAQYVDWTAAVVAVEGNGATVTGAGIVANGDQAPGTTDTVTDISYGGQGVTGAPLQPTPPNPGPPAAGPQPTGAGRIYSYTDYGASCLTATGAGNGTGLVLDRCGDHGGAGQNFTLAWAGRHEVLEAVARSGWDAKRNGDALCVTAPSGAGQLTVQPCTGSAGQDVARHGDYYVFEGDDGYVMDDRGWSTTPGTPVIAWPWNGGRNQHWSAPTSWQ